MIDEVNFKNLLIADFYIRFREEINKKGMFERYSKEEIAGVDGIAKKAMSFFQAPDAKQKLEQIAAKVFDEVRKLDATQHILNKEEKFAEIKAAFFKKFEENQNFSDTDFLEFIDETADGNEFFKQFALLVKKDGKVSEWEKQAIYQLGNEFKLSQKEIDKHFKSSTGLIIALIIIVLLGGAVFLAMQNNDVKQKINGLFGNYQQSPKSDEKNVTSSDDGTTITTDDYKVTFDEYEIRQKLAKRTAFYSGGFSQTIDSEKEPDIFEDFKWGERQILLPVRANFKYLFYLDEIGEIVCDDNGIVKLTLPPIHLQEESCDVDWLNVVEKVSWNRKNFTPEEKTRMKNIAEKYLIDIAEKNYEYKAKATQNAEQILTAFFNELGFKVIIYKTTTIILDKK